MVNIKDGTRVAIDAALLAAPRAGVTSAVKLPASAGLDFTTAFLAPMAYHYGIRDTVRALFAQGAGGNLAEVQARALFYAAVALSQGSMASAFAAGLAGEVGGLADTFALKPMGL